MYEYLKMYEHMYVTYVGMYFFMFVCKYYVSMYDTYKRRYIKKYSVYIFTTVCVIMHYRVIVRTVGANWAEGGGKTAAEIGMRVLGGLGYPTGAAVSVLEIVCNSREPNMSSCASRSCDYVCINV